MNDKGSWYCEWMCRRALKGGDALTSRHVAGCARCRETLAAYADLGSYLRTEPALLPAGSPPTDLWDRVSAGIETRTAAPILPYYRRPAWVVAGVGAASLALGYLFAPLPHRTTQTVASLSVKKPALPTSSAREADNAAPEAKQPSSQKSSPPLRTPAPSPTLHEKRAGQPGSNAPAAPPPPAIASPASRRPSLDAVAQKRYAALKSKGMTAAPSGAAVSAPSASSSVAPRKPSAVARLQDANALDDRQDYAYQQPLGGGGFGGGMTPPAVRSPGPEVTGEASALKPSSPVMARRDRLAKTDTSRSLSFNGAVENTPFLAAPAAPPVNGPAPNAPPPPPSLALNPVNADKATSMAKAKDKVEGPHQGKDFGETQGNRNNDEGLASSSAFGGVVAESSATGRYRSVKPAAAPRPKGLDTESVKKEKPIAETEARGPIALQRQADTLSVHPNAAPKPLSDSVSDLSQQMGAKPPTTKQVPSEQPSARAEATETTSPNSSTKSKSADSSLGMVKTPETKSGTLAGRAYREGRWTDAIRAYKSVKKPDAETLYRLGMAYKRLHRLPEARQAFRDALKRNPHYAPALKALKALGR